MDCSGTRQREYTSKMTICPILIDLTKKRCSTVHRWGTFQKQMILIIKQLNLNDNLI